MRRRTYENVSKINKGESLMLNNSAKEIFGLNESKLKKLGISLVESETEFLSIKIESYEQFDCLISLINEISFKIDNGNKYYYRGVVNCNYDLRSSVQYRLGEHREADLVNGMLSKAATRFGACKSEFESISLMRHYGLPTRFLDFSKNPLVALWFACQDVEYSREIKDDDKDGAVYIACSKKRTTKRFIDIICKLITTENYGPLSNDISEMISWEDFKYYLKEFFENKEKLFFIDTPIFDQRESNQQSVFLVAINKMQGFSMDIEKSNKEYLNWNIGGVYAEKYEVKEFFSKQANFYKNLLASFKNDYVKGKGTFEGLHCYDKKHSKGNILKIIIPKEIKKDIKYKLECRGITKDFIYPTLENVAERVIWEV